ncbi:MAG: hypothetical protein K2P94_03425 [Rhodospirillaceae bacterium]|nr:hypothetical protein [Rhodospirillaceae bacterium]
MIRLVVMYNLPDGADEATFLEWRLGPHQRSNAALPLMLRTDFGRIVKAWPDSAVPRFRFVMILEWPNMAAFERAFYAPEVQAGLLENIKKLGDYEYSISEILISSENIEAELS